MRDEYEMPFLRCKLRIYTNCYLLKLFLKPDIDNNDHVLDISWGIWNFRYFKKKPNKEWH